MSKYILVAVVAVLIGIAGTWTTLRWLGTAAAPAGDAAADAKPHNHAHAEAEEHVKLSKQARANLRLRVGKPQFVKETYWRSVRVPGEVIEKPASCERLISSPVGGVVKSIPIVRGEAVRTGEPLFVIELISEQLHALQADLFRTSREQQLVQQEKDRLQEAFKSGALAASRMIEIDNQLKRLLVNVEARTSELTVRGFSAADLEQVKQGKFVKEITLSTPPFGNGPAAGVPDSPSLHTGYDVEQVRAMIGEQVQPGQALGVLADHHELYLEGRVFSTEAGPLQLAAKEGRSLRAEFAAEAPAFSAGGEQDLTIVNVANRVDPANQTLSFYLRLPNQYQEYRRDGKTFRLWRYRPGQRATLQVPAEAFTNVFVVPAEAIVREGAEVFVFREEGELFERVRVHLLQEDPRSAIVANDGSLKPDETIALNAAVQLNWTLKAQAAAEGGEAEERHHHH